MQPSTFADDSHRDLRAAVRDVEPIAQDAGDVKEEIRSQTRISNAQPAQEILVDHERIELGRSHDVDSARRATQQRYLADDATA